MEVLVKTRRETETDVEVPVTRSVSGGGDAAELSAMLAVGRSVINRALSDESARFLEQTRQRGGE